MHDFVAEDLKQFMRSFPQGVTLVTTSKEGSLLGITISSFTSISMEPPLIMIAISRDATSYNDFANCKVFNVQLLSEKQEAVAMKFATKISHDSKFRDLQFSLDSQNNPVIADTLANLLCSRYQTYQAGDHSLILGKVENSTVSRDSLPLVYYKRCIRCF